MAYLFWVVHRICGILKSTPDRHSAFHKVYFKNKDERQVKVMEKLKVVIADDEKKICLLLRNLIDWEENGMEIVGEANNGLDAWRLLKEEHPDIVILDIRMPGMDGLELLQKIREMDERIKVILISGHKHFEYAHTALRYGVENYLLKPINGEELLNNLQIVKSKILQENGEAHSRSVLKVRLSESIEKVRKNFLAVLSEDGSKVQQMELEEANREYYLHLSRGHFRLGLIRVGGLQKQQVEIVLEYAASFIENSMKQSVGEVLCQKRKNELLCLFNYAEELVWREKLQEVFERIVQKYEDVCSFSMGISEDWKWIRADMLTQAKDAMFYHFRTGAHKIIFYSEDMKAREDVLGNEWYKKLNQAIEIESMQQVTGCFADLMRLVERRTMSPSALYSVLENVGELLETSDTNKKHESGTTVKAQYMDNISRAKTERELVAVAEKEILRMIRIWTEQREMKDSKYVRLAKSFIDANYTKELSLDEVAGEVGINASYFSSLFKKEQGITFSDYLTEIRISRAKEMLEEGKMNVSEVGWAVGYRDQKYFSKLFLKVVGIKPSEYKKLYS